jgi:5-methylcytosine-specific restriction endonuclease McrA
MRQSMVHPLLMTTWRKPRRGEVKKCLVCDNEFYVRPSEVISSKYCSIKCRCVATHKERTPLICLFCGKKYEVYSNYLKHRTSKFCSKKCAYDYSSIYRSGKNSTNWKGGVSTTNRRLRNSKKWKLWREAVFERDNYICQNCGQRGGILEPHHLKQFAFYPKQRFAVSNGQTLCYKCHQLTKKNEKVIVTL